MGRLGHIDTRVIWPEAREGHAEAVDKERVELGITNPGFVEDHVLAQVADAVQELALVVAHTVIGRVGQDGQAERSRPPVSVGVGDSGFFWIWPRI
jgi:hypothetical protein